MGFAGDDGPFQGDREGGDCGDHFLARESIDDIFVFQLISV